MAKLTIKQQLAAARELNAVLKENQALKAGGTVPMSVKPAKAAKPKEPFGMAVGAVGSVDLTGILAGRRLGLYPEQLLEVIANGEAIKAFIGANAGQFRPLVNGVRETPEAYCARTGKPLPEK